ncbi:MAG TPA: hypothetical protein VN773_00885 [Verrucomicrobiae bacterium]|nr:hypothetical protein [Verrucomicrobiae bacterium]
MIHEHDELLLASAAIDFGLSDEEAERLRQAIHDCPVCAQRASAYRRQFQLLAELPVLEPSDVVRRRVLGAVATGRVRQSRSPMFLLLAAALVIGATLALVAVVAGGALFRPKTIAEFPPVDQSVGPGPSAVARASERGVLPSQPADPSSGGPPTAIAVDSVAEVISTNLRLRSQPRIAADSIKFEPFLDVGDRLFVVDGPVVATDHDWYQVKVWRPSDPGATWPIGWVASADINGTPWIAAATLACPPGPGVDQLAAMNRYEALACYGRRTITFRGLVGSSEPVAPCPADPVGACLGGPAWLAGSGGPFVTTDSRSLTSGVTPPLFLARDPNGSVTEDELPAGRMATIEGAFDDAAASTCKLEGTPTSVSTLTVTDAILRCRTTFVVLSATPAPAWLDLQASAITTTPNLRVRSQPIVDDSSERYEPLLDTGTRLFVIDGPVLGSGYDWYRVIVPAVTRAGGEPMVGWIAVASKTGEIWAKGVALSCPPVDAFVGVADLARLASGSVPDGGASCFGDVRVATTARIAVTCVGPDAQSTSTTDWLAAPARMAIHVVDGTAAFDARIHPDLAGRTACDVPPNDRWVVEGHFQDSGAESCAAGAASDEAAEMARYRCRSIFVVTALTPAP